MLFGSRAGFSGTAELWCNFRISKIQDGGIHALLSRVTLASAGLSCFTYVTLNNVFDDDDDDDQNLYELHYTALAVIPSALQATQ